MYLFFNLGGVSVDNQRIDLNGFCVRRIGLPVFSSLHALLWSLFSGKVWCYKLIDKNNVVVTTAQVCHKFYKFPFMTKGSLHIGPCITHPDYRGRGYYPFLLSQIIKDNRGCELFMIVNEKNKSGIRGVVKAGFIPFAKGIKDRFGRFVITEMLKDDVVF